MDAMNGKQRFMKLLAGEAPDFVPRTPILMRYAAEYIGSDYGAFTADHSVLVEANIRCAEDFGFDQLSAISDPYREATGFGGVPVFDPGSGVHLERPPLADGVDLGLLAHPDPQTSPRMRDRLDAIAAMASRFGDTYSVLGWVEGPAAEAADLRGVQDFFVDLLGDPEPLCDLMDHVTEVGISFALAQVAAGADTIGIGDAVASQVPPDIYEQMILPRERRLVDAIKAAGVRVKMHICGNITHLLPGLATLGLDLLDVDHMVSLPAVRKAVGDKVVLCANLDPVEHVLRGTPALIRDELRRARDEAGPAFVAGAGCEIPSGTPPAILKALCEPLGWEV